MRRRRKYSSLLFATWFVAGAMTGWWLRGGPPQPRVSTIPPTPQGPPAQTRAAPDEPERASTLPPETAREPAISAAVSRPSSAIDELTHRNLATPIDHADFERWKGMFEEGRDANGRLHEAVDIIAARNTPVHAVENGTIAKLFYSRAGGNTVYEFDPDQRFCYYYAHLERYAAGLEAGQQVVRGQIIGYVGTSGNASAATPHLHFAIFLLDTNRHWWQGRPLDPYLVFKEERR